MSAVAVTQSKANRALRFYGLTNGKKVIVAVTGVALFGFVVGHLIGNLQVFLGPEVMNAYGATLHSNPALLWSARIILLAAVILHITASVQLAIRAKAARPEGYRKWNRVKSSYASRTMIWSGPIIGAFVVYHLLHFTLGNAMGWQGRQFATQTVDGHVIPAPYENVVAGFQNPIVSGAYIFAMALLMLHLRHGLWSMFQTVGLNHSRLSPRLQRFASVFSLILFIGYISIPIAVMLGIVR
ncbi:MAG: succinate dehydrogenase cytochrome b subunit [Bryobacteraceae bacterium]|jgi:succinate dehydrogenase (or fumarate reductase) cytochrome b subunit, b558 family|nr:succinate dehydrogenase cytochrome b subunit [Bryobacteraceae bacterium]